MGEWSGRWHTSSLVLADAIVVARCSVAARGDETLDACDWVAGVHAGVAGV